MKSSDEDLVVAFREAFNNLPDRYKLKEVDRAWAIAHDKKMIVLEDHDIGKVLKFLDMKNLIEYFYQRKNIVCDRSYMYKCLKGKGRSAYGYKIYYEEII